MLRTLAGSAGGVVVWLVAGLAPAPADELPDEEPALRFSALTPEDGLSQGSVWALAQDDRGFLWLGTENGLDRYDGGGVQSHDLVEAGLGSSFARALLADGDSLWVGTDGGGLARLDLATGAIHPLRHDPGDPRSLTEDEVVALALDAAGRLWVGTRGGGVQRLSEDRESFEPPLGTGADGCPSLAAGVQALLGDRAGGLWVATASGLYHRPPGRRCLEPALASAEPERLSDRQLTHLRQDGEGMLWVASRGGLDRVDPVRGTVVASRLAGEHVTTSIETRDGEVWAGLAGGGLVRLGPKRASRYRHRPLDDTSLSSDTVRALFEDRSGVLWVGTEQGGADRVAPSQRRLGTRRIVTTERGRFRLRGVFALYGEPDGTLWVGTRDQGLFVLPAAGGVARHWMAGEGEPDPLDTGRISVLAAGDAPEEVLVGTAEGTLYRADRRRGRLHRLPRFTDRSLRAIEQRPDGGLWVATWGAGLFELSPAGDVLRRWTTAGGGGIGADGALADDIVLCLETDPGGALWAGTWSGGLERIDPASGRVEHHRGGPGGVGALPSDRVASLFAAGFDLWVGTDRGLRALSTATGEVSGPPLFTGVTIFAQLADDAGHLWLTTDRGLYHLDPESRHWERFLDRHGLQDDEFNVGAAARVGAGELAFGGLDGINRLRPHLAPTGFHVFWPETPPPLMLTRLSAGGRDLSTEVGGDGAVELAPGERELSFRVALLDYAAPESHRFAFRLRGRDEEWTDLGRQRSGTLYDLSPGRYTFEVVGWELASAVPGAELRLPLRVRPAFGQRPAVRLTAAVAGVALVALSLAGVYRLRLRRQLRAGEEAIEVRQRLLEAREEERAALARELHDGPLQRLHALQLAISRGPASPAAWRWHGEVDELAREVRGVCTRLRSPVLETLGLVAALRELVEEPQLAASPIDLDLTADDLEIAPATAQALYRVAREALSNALRHGGAARIVLRLSGNGARAELEVEDDGVGFAPPARWIDLARRGHMGILGMMERVESVGGTLAVDSLPGRGTRIRAVVRREDEG